MAPQSGRALTYPVLAVAGLCPLSRVPWGSPWSSAAAPVLSATARPIGTEHPSARGRVANDPRAGEAVSNATAEVANEESAEVSTEETSENVVVDGSAEAAVETQADTEETKKQG